MSHHVGLDHVDQLNNWLAGRRRQGCWLIHWSDPPGLPPGGPPPGRPRPPPPNPPPPPPEFLICWSSSSVNPAFLRISALSSGLAPFILARSSGLMLPNFLANSGLKPPP